LSSPEAEASTLPRSTQPNIATPTPSRNHDSGNAQPGDNHSNPFIVDGDINIGDDAEQSQRSEEEEEDGDEAESHTTDSGSNSDSDIDMLDSVATATAIPPPQDTSLRRRPVPRSSDVVPSSAMETNNTGSISIRSDIRIFSGFLTS
jgi:hypothetical protein